MIEIFVENIGRIKQADVKLEDITIIAGVNNTGKSTMSKILYSGMKPSSEIGRERVCSEISEEVIAVLETLSNELKEKHSDLINSIYLELKNKKYTILVRKISELLETSIIEDDRVKINGLLSTLTLKDTNILENYLKNDLGEFLDDFNEEQKIKIVKDERILMEYHPEGKNNRPNSKTILTIAIIPKVEIYNVIYISTPYILDKIKYPTNYITMIEEDFMNDFQRNYFSKGIISLNKKSEQLKLIEKEIEKIIQGKLILKTPQEIKYSYLSSGGEEEEEEINLNNTATGIKSLGMLLKLLTNDSIKEDTILIFDEPEVHLHPEWQVKLAGILVALVKHLKIKIFINSHSSEFIEAIQLYSIKDGIKGLRAYLAEEVKNKIIFTDKTENFGNLFNELGKGYDILDKIKMEIEK